MVDLSNARELNFVDGKLVSSEHERLVREIEAYAPGLRVEFIPVGVRKEGEPAFRVVYEPIGSHPQTLFYVEEENFDARVLARIIMNDQSRNGGVNLSEYEAWETAQQRLKAAEHEERMAEAHDITKHVMRSHLNNYKVHDGLIIRD